MRFRLRPTYGGQVAGQAPKKTLRLLRRPVAKNLYDFGVILFILERNSFNLPKTSFFLYAKDFEYFFRRRHCRQAGA